MRSAVGRNTLGSTSLAAYLAGQRRPITLAEIAREAGVPRQYVWQVARGSRPPSAKVVAACERLGIPTALVFGAELARDAPREDSS